MGGGVSVLHRRTRRHVDLENRTPTPSTPRRTLNNGLTLLQNATCRFKISFKRKRGSKDYTKPFRELICNWPLTDVEALLEEFEANAQLYSLQQECDAARQAEINFSDHFSASRTSLANLKIIFKDQTFDVHHRFISFRCKYFKDLCASTSELDLTPHFEEIDVDDFRSFIDYVYTEKWEGDRENLEELRKKFECNGVLAEDCVLMEKEDLQSGDLIIGLSNTAENKTSFQPYKIRCDASVVGARSQLLQSLLARAPKNALDLTEITLDENIFPRALAPLFVHFFYTDQLDLNMISKSDMSLSSLSEAQAIISGRSPNLNLHRALQVMQVAKFFNIEKLVQLCEDVVVQSLSVENCVAVLNWASDGGSKFVARHALRIVEREFPKIVNTPSLFDLSQETMLTITASQFVQVTEVELLEAIIKWGEHELLKRLEEREPNILADTCHSISRRGLRRAELSGDELKDILRPLLANVRTDFVLPPFHQSLTTAYNRGLLERAPLREDLVVCSTTEEINPDLLWFRPAETSLGPRYFIPYHQTLVKQVAHMRAHFNEGKSVFDEPEGVEKDQFKPRIQLKTTNLMPQVLDEAKFQETKEAVCRAIYEADEIQKIRLFPRKYHEAMAVQLITRKLLCELDVAEECFHCELDSEEDPGDSEDVENGAGSPQLSASTPDVLPL